jgi:ATP:ADP antiporter, AAA family
VKVSAIRLFNVRPEEQAKVALMLSMGFFIGIFVATYQVTAESLFLNRLSGNLNQAFLISGGLGIGITLIFSFIQSRVRFVSLVLLSLVIIFLSTSALNYFYHFGTEQLQVTVLFLMYCLVGPLTALLLLCYWGIFARLFDFKQSKRIIGWIDTGQLLAIIMANLFIPLTARLFPDTSDYLMVCDISIVGAIVCLTIITIKFGLARQPSKITQEVRRETRFPKIFNDRYVVLLSLFVITSVVTLNFNQFIFQNLLNQQYPNQRDLTNFLAYFNGAIYLLSFAMQSFLNDRIIAAYGLRLSLFILPIITGFFAAASFTAALIFGYDVLANADTFIYFFLFVAMSRLFNSMLRESIENPVFKLMFVPLETRTRFGIQVKVEGVISESGRLIAGIFIFSLSLISFFELLWIPLFVVGLCMVYLVIVHRLYGGYKSKIRAKLEATDQSQEKLDVGFNQVMTRLETQLTDIRSAKAVFSYRLLEKLNPYQVGVWINSLMKNEEESVREYAQRRLNEMKGLSVSDQYVIRANQGVLEADTKKMLSKADLQSILSNGGDVAKKRIQKLVRSEHPDDRQYAAELLLHSSTDDNATFLLELLLDPEPKVRRTAITTSVKLNNQEIILALISNLSNPLFGNRAMNSLALIGAKALPHLENSFYQSGQSTQTLLRIVQIIGRIGGQRAKDLLWGKIDYHDKVVVSQVLLSLGESGFKAGISQITRIKYAIENDIENIAWNLNARESLGNDSQVDLLKLALIEEDRHDIDHIYMLLAMLYDTRSIQLVKENIESGTTEGTSYALELLDVFLSDQLKAKVIPVLDDLSNGEKIGRLEIFYPRIKLDSKLAIKFLLNRDFNQTNRWTKACAIEQIGIHRVGDFKLDLIAQLFNPDLLLREMAGWALYQIDPTTYHFNTKRLSKEHKVWLDRCIVAEQQAKLRFFEKTKFFQTLPIFEGVSGRSLSFLSDLSKEIRLNQEESISIDEKINNDFFIVFDGILQYYEKGIYITDYNKGQFVGEIIAPMGFANSNLLVAKEPSILLKINKDEFYELLSDNIKLTDRVLDYI